MRFKPRDLIIYMLLFVFVAAFPIDLIRVSDLYKILISIGLRLLLVSFYIYLIIRERIKIFGITNYRYLLFCIPFVLACFSNMIASKIDGFVGTPKVGLDILFATIAYMFVSAISEEIIFRLFIQNSFMYTTTFKRILYSALIFALLHLVNLANVASIEALVGVIIQVVYNFGLGLMLGIIYEYSHSLVAAILFHFGFNLFNDVLVSYYQFNSSPISFYLTALVIAFVLAGYSFLVYHLYLKKLDRFYRE